MQPLAFSKELLPVGARCEGELERPRAVSEYLVERFAIAGATRICFVIAPGKSDILEYFGGTAYGAAVCYTIQPQPSGLCDAIFRAIPLIDSSETVMVGLPDTLWFPEDALCALPNEGLSFLLFPVAQPERFDAVETDETGRVLRIQVKQPQARSNWIWGAFKMPATILRQLFE
jgi:dTDP-glucose pyrophosphorylase